MLHMPTHYYMLWRLGGPYKALTCDQLIRTTTVFTAKVIPYPRVFFYTGEVFVLCLWSGLYLNLIEILQDYYFFLFTDDSMCQTS